MKTVFFGSPEEAVPALSALVDSGHEIVAVYTRPDRRAGRARQLRPTPVKVAAESFGLAVETPPGLRDEAVQEKLASLGASLFVVVAYGRFLPPEVLAIPRLGVLNIHPSLLPRHRGPSPVTTAILNGENETGVTLMLLDEGMDSGPVLAQSEPVQLDGSERAGELTARLFEIGAAMLPSVIAGLEDGSLTPHPQDESLVTVTRLVEKEDGQIDWSRGAAEIERMTRAYDPWPGAFTALGGKSLKVIAAEVATDSSSSPVAGPIAGTVSVRDRRVFVATGAGELELTEAQPEGRRPVSARDWLNGTPDVDGSVLGAE